MTFATFATNAMKRRFFASLEGLDYGRLHLTTPEGTVHRFGASGPAPDLYAHFGITAEAVVASVTARLAETQAPEEA